MFCETETRLRPGLIEIFETETRLRLLQNDFPRPRGDRDKKFGPRNMRDRDRDESRVYERGGEGEGEEVVYGLPGEGKNLKHVKVNLNSSSSYSGYLEHMILCLYP